MPALPFANKVLRIQFQFSLGTPLTPFGGFRVFWQYSTSAPDVPGIFAFLTTASTAWNTHFAAIMSTKYTLTQLVATDLTSATGLQVVQSASVVGTDAGLELATQDAVLINHKI